MEDRKRLYSFRSTRTSHRVRIATKPIRYCKRRHTISENTIRHGQCYSRAAIAMYVVTVQDSYFFLNSIDGFNIYFAWQITVDHNIYQEVVCFERHQLVPFSNNASGATTTSSMKLSLNDEETYEIMSASGYDETEPIKKRETLLFNHFPTPKPTTGEIRASRELLQKMCKSGFPDIKRQFIDAFSKFLQTAKFLSSAALHQLLARSSSICTDSRNGKWVFLKIVNSITKPNWFPAPLHRNHILESLPYIGSAASVKMMTSEIIKKSVSPGITQKWLTSMSFLPR